VPSSLLLLPPLVLLLLQVTAGDARRVMVAVAAYVATANG